MIKPTVGRVVWFRPVVGLPEGFHTYDGTQPCSAIVTYVWGGGDYVNLAVFDHGGDVHAFTSVPLRQEDQLAPESNYCEWMPYQIGQAKKDEVKGTGLSESEMSIRIQLFAIIINQTGVRSHDAAERALEALRILRGETSNKAGLQPAQSEALRLKPDQTSA